MCSLVSTESICINLKRDSSQRKMDLKSIVFLNFFVWKIKFSMLSSADQKTSQQNRKKKRKQGLRQVQWISRVVWNCLHIQIRKSLWMMKSDKESPAIKPPNMALQGTSKKHQHSYQPQTKKKKNPNVNQQKQFFRQTGPSNSKRPAAKSGVKLTRILLILPRWIFLRIKWSQLGFTTFQKVFAQIWQQFECFPWGWSSFLKQNH